jgi:GT2 family glycosyltransferase
MVVQTDYVVRGPLVLRKNLFERFGYLDEVYAPLYVDDLDLCFRLSAHGYRTMLYPLNVVNAGLTQAHYDSQKTLWFEQMILRNTARLCERRRPGAVKRAHISLPMPTFNSLVERSGYGYRLALLAVLVSRALFDLKSWILSDVLALLNWRRWISPSRAEFLTSAWKRIAGLFD